MTNDRLKEQIDILVKLQEIESESAKIRRALDAVPEKMEGIDRQRQYYEETISEQQSTINALAKKYRTLEADAKVNQSMIQKSRGKLLSVKTNKEYQSSLKEIDDLQARNSTLEDEMLECLEEMDEADRIWKEKKAEFKKVSETLELQKKRLEQEATAARVRIGQLEEKKQSVGESVDPELLKIFNYVRNKQANGIAIVPVIQEMCHGCNVFIPPQKYNELQHFEKIEFCPNCQRIIYWRPA